MKKDITYDELLAKIPNKYILTIVGGEEKADAVYSYLNTKPANATLIIDEAICKKIIKKVNKNF